MTTVHVYHDGAGTQIADVVRRATAFEVIALDDPAALRAALGEVEILFAPDPPRDGWSTAGVLRLIQLLGVGADRLLPSPDLPAAVEIAGARGVFAVEVAEHVIAMLLASSRRLVDLVDDQRARRFLQSPRGTLAGETVTIVGLGEVGRRVARIANALGMHVRGVSRSAVPCDGVEVIAIDQLAGAVADARFIVLALPLTPATRGLCDVRLLAHMRADAFVVNVARGGVVDEAALIDALRANRLGGAALDVFEHEPLEVDHPLWTTRGVIISPHVAGLGERYVERCVEVLVDNVARLVAGMPRRGVVDRAHGY